MLHNVHQLDLNYFCLLFDAKQVAYRAVLAKNSDQLWRKNAISLPEQFAFRRTLRTFCVKDSVDVPCGPSTFTND